MEMPFSGTAFLQGLDKGASASAYKGRKMPKHSFRLLKVTSRMCSAAFSQVSSLILSLCVFVQTVCGGEGECWVVLETIYFYTLKGTRFSVYKIA